jgi:group I intron endonuclease
MGVIYKITSPTSKVYVGKTYDLRKRINAHKCASKKGVSHILHNSVRKYGWDAHVLEIIETIEDDKLNERETFWIEELKTYCYENESGMNMTKGGDGQRSTWMHKIELRKYFSDRFSGEGNPFHGKKHTDETKQLMGRKASERNIKRGTLIPKWAYEKGLDVIRKKVVCYNDKGEFIAKYNSIAEAANAFNINSNRIIDSCKEDTTGVDGKYIFRYWQEGFPIKINTGKINAKTVKRPVVWLTPEYEVAMEFTSAQAASDFIGIPKTTINRAAMYNYLMPIRTGHIFFYKDLWEEISQAV